MDWFTDIAREKEQKRMGKGGGQQVFYLDILLLALHTCSYTVDYLPASSSKFCSVSSVNLCLKTCISCLDRRTNVKPAPFSNSVVRWAVDILTKE